MSLDSARERNRLAVKKYRESHREEIKAKQKKTRAENLEKARKYDVDWKFKKRHGIYREERDAMFLGQGCMCANMGCRRKAKSVSELALDHNHTTGVNREFLCPPCNQALGLLQEDEAKIIGLLSYLYKHERKVGQGCA